jgi:DMSO/TMAO reductase YedYZ molybdopterin-dependent catalytic subunit
MKSFILLVTGCLFLLCATAFSQTSSDVFITVEGEVLKPLKLSAKDLGKFPQTDVKAKDRDGREHTFKGTLLSIVLDSAGVTLGKELRGENLAKYILVKAVDGYEVIYSLPEVDAEFTSNTVLLATHVDGKPLPKGEGPFRLVNPIEKRPARWIREISTIKILFSKD